MTIRVKVTNEDTREDAVIVVRGRTPDGDPAAECIDQELSGGQSAVMHLHSGMNMLVEERSNKPEAVTPAVPDASDAAGPETDSGAGKETSAA